MITPDQLDEVRVELLALLQEDASNAKTLVARLESLEEERGLDVKGALLLALTGMNFTEQEARDHWSAIREHHERLLAALGPSTGVRTSVLDYFLNLNRKLAHPKLIDLALLESEGIETSADSRTGLPNERGFRRMVDAELRRAKRFGARVAVVLLDLDNFRMVNDVWGRPLADRLLAEAGLIVHNKIRDVDSASRPGEDEFAIVLPETDRNGALLVAERVRRELEAHFAHRKVRGKSLDLTISAGVAACPEDGTAPEELLTHAAEALYRAKSTGKNRVEAWHEERRRFLRFELEPGRFEVEVLGEKAPGGAAVDLSHAGVLFRCPEQLAVGDWIEIRLIESPGSRPLRHHALRAQVVRVEELPRNEVEKMAETVGYRDPYEIGVAFTLDQVGSESALWRLLEGLYESEAGA